MLVDRSPLVSSPKSHAKGQLQGTEEESPSTGNDLWDTPAGIGNFNVDGTFQDRLKSPSQGEPAKV